MLMQQSKTSCSEYARIEDQDLVAENPEPSLALSLYNNNNNKTIFKSRNMA